MFKKISFLLIYLMFTQFFWGSAVAQDLSTEDDISPELSAGTMTNERMQEIIGKLDPEFTGNPGFWRFSINEIPVQVITDANADRMRIIVPIRESDGIDEVELYRILQANFDSTLDARYAIARGVLWGIFVHPLSSLNDRDFVSGIGQTINIVLSYGQSYSSGMFTFGGGDSGELLDKQLIEELLRRGDLI